MTARSARCMLLLLALVAAFHGHGGGACVRATKEPGRLRWLGGLSRASFPKGFVFGTATSAYQVEGMATGGGRGPSIWDAFAHTPGKVVGNQNADVTTDQYHRYKEDVNLMKGLNFEAYRFSISWSRIFPDGEGKVNEEGVAYYNNLIDYLLQKGITPYVNLYHYDLPLALEKKYGGWLNAKTVELFADYADFCFKTFGDRVTHWFTFNEPSRVAIGGYDIATTPPQRFLDPLINGQYPQIMQDLVKERLPRFTPDEAKVVKGSADWIGVNQYTTEFVKGQKLVLQRPTSYSADLQVTYSFERNGKPIGPRASSKWLYIVPRGMYGCVHYISQKYGNPPMLITKNGMDQPGNLTRDQYLRDATRVRYYRSYLCELKKAIDGGANVLGYFAWSLLDNFEWMYGYTSKFGIVYVNFNSPTLERHPKASAYWFRDLLQH
ncbi:beta-glucosidase 7-like [Triticum aestivum]|uniref:beta-glucosidase 7-like n=1 Tax=Triticum aestivum TaxID=4565 RepID=UPI001D00FAE1|nr:beta-glucosidase 7-like [Triticum aestivum]